MKSTYDPEADAAYFYFGEGEVAETEELAHNLIVDRDAAGLILGLEVLHASRKLAPGDWFKAPLPDVAAAELHAAE